jgi:hypothetical protein
MMRTVSLGSGRGPNVEAEFAGSGSIYFRKQ